MSRTFSKQKTRFNPPQVPTVDSTLEVIIADSTLEIEVEDQFTAAVPYEIFSEKIQLMEFSDAYWSLKIRCTHANELGYYCFFYDFDIVGFPKELQKDCLMKFSCEGRFNQTIPYQSTFSCGPCNSCSTKTTVNLTISKKDAVVSASNFSVHSAPHKQLLDNISNTYGDETFSDFTFIVKRKQFKVHKSILAASSVVMRKLFTAEYKEKETGECVIDDIEPDIFEALICFMYRCTVPENLSDIVYELYAAAHYYEVETLKNICLDEMQRNLSKENANEAYVLAFNYDLKKLLADSWKIIKRDVLKVNLPENVEPLPPSEVAAILELREKEQAFYKKHTKAEEKEESK